MTSGKRTPGSTTTESQVAATAASSNPPTPAPTAAAVDSSASDVGEPPQSTTMEMDETAAATIINKPEEDSSNSTQKQKISVEQKMGAEEEMSKSSKKQQQQRQQRPEEYIDGLWEADPFYYCSNGPTTAKGAQQFYVPSLDPLDPASERRHKRGLVYKSRDNGGATNEYECFQCHEGVIYRPGDQVFVESTREEPWLIGSIVSFKMKKRDQLLVKLIRYYRPNDVPELSFSLIHQERIEEGHYNHLQQPAAADSPTATAGTAAGTPPAGQSHHSRELFSSESTLLFHVSALRGKCTVKLVKDLRAAQAEIDLNDPDSFFNCLNYNQESGRLATVQMTIRVGSAHQAEVPSCSSSSLSDEPDRDELLYRPGYLCAETEQRYVKMARTFRTFSLMNNKRITMLEKSARTGDLLLDDALTTLHRSGYSIMEAISTMQAIDQHLTSDSSFMSADDVKKFGKGIKQYGKNFNKINKELLPHHRREQLVAFYYLWKKSRDATRPKPLSTAKRNQVAVGRRGKNGNGNGAINGSGQHFVGITGANSFGSGKIVAENGNPTAAAIAVGAGQAEVKPSVEMLIPPLEDLMDYASASEAETDQFEQQPSGSGRACHHCFSSKSKDWHHAGRDRLLMCTDCRLFYKKYGQLRPVDRPSTVPPCLLANIKQESNEEDENEEPAAGNRIRTRGALAARQHHPRRTPSSLEVGTEQRLRGTPQKLSAEEEQQQRRGTPLRNSATKPGNGGRKRALKSGSGETDEPTPPKAKRQKKNAASPSSNVCSRTPSPGNQAEEAAVPIKKKTPKKERKQKEDEKKKEKEVDEKLDEKEAKLLQKANAKEGTVTPPLNTGTEMKALPTTSAGSPCSSDPCSSTTTGTSSASSAVNSSGNSPQQHHQMSVEEKQRADTLAAVDLAAMKKREPKTPDEPPKPNPPTAAATIIAKKPVAKVEPLDTGKKESAEVVAATGEIKPEEQQSPKEEQPIICVDSSSDEEWEQDQGTLGEEDCTEVYRTAEGKKDFEGKLIPPEARTILQRCLKRANGLTCARTDIAYVEPPERKQHNFQRRERDRLKKEQERAAKQQQLQKQQQMTAAAAAAATAGNAQPPMGGAAKKMEMPAEFGGNPNTGGLLANGLPHPNASAVSAAQHPMAAMLMNGFGPLGHHLPAQIQQGNHSNTPAAANAPQTSTMPSGMPGIPQIPPHHPFAALAAAAAGHHPPNSAAAAHQHPLLGPAGLNPSAAAANASMIHQQEQALINAMLNDPRLMQQLQSYFQQQPQLLAGQTNQQQQMLQMQMLLGLQHQQEQKLLEQLQRQQQQQKQAAQAAAQQQQQQRPQTAMHLNGQHPLMNGLTHHAATAGIGHKMSTGTAPTPGHFGPHHQQQASATQQQQHKDSNAHAQQQQAAAAAMMSQLFGGAFPNPSQQQVAMMAMQAQQQQQRLSMQQQAHHQQQGVSTTSSSTQGHPTHHGHSQHPQHSVQQNHGQQQQNPSQNHQQQQVAAQMAAEMAALTAAIQQQQHGQQNHQQQLAAMQQQQQIQQVMAIMNVSGLPVQEQRLLEEQIRVYLLNNHQQQQQMAAAAAAATQQQQAAQQAQNSAAQQQQAQQNAAQQQLLAFAAAGGAMPPGAEQIMAAAMAQQMALQQQQQSSSGPSAPTSSSTAAAAAHQAAGAFQQQLMQVMAMQQQQQQSNAQQQQAAHAHMLQQQMEMMVRRNQQQQEQHRR